MDINRVRERLLTTRRVASKLLLRLERQFHTIGNAWSIVILEPVAPGSPSSSPPNLQHHDCWKLNGARTGLFLPKCVRLINCWELHSNLGLGGVLELYCGIRDSCSLIQLPRINHVCSWSPESCHTAKVHQNDKISMVFLLLNKIK